MSLKQHPSNKRSDRSVDASDSGLAADRDAATGRLHSDADRPRTPAYAEQLLLRMRVAALEQELADSRAERQAIIDRYEALLSESRTRSETRARATPDLDRRSRGRQVLERAREWLSRRR
jgi:hypothetical protein